MTSSLKRLHMHYMMPRKLSIMHCHPLRVLPRDTSLSTSRWFELLDGPFV
jgi:hypothetical protein